MPYYFDNASTTPINKEVLEAMTPWLSSDWGNPSSKYLIGRKAHKAISGDALSELAHSQDSERLSHINSPRVIRQ